MSLLKFIFSKQFLVQLGIAIVALVIIVFGTLQWLKYSTNHSETITVPNLSKLSLDIVDKKLAEMNLRYTVLDSASFNPEYPPFSVLDQTPLPGKKVKEQRKIYLTVNPSGYAEVEIPNNLIRKTLRQVQPSLLARGFKIGDTIEKPDMAKGAVLELQHKGQVLKSGDKLPKTSVVDIVIGDGSLKYGQDADEAKGLNNNTVNP
jgi:beta-lactam-binding protein with PASTA domain